MKTVTLHVTKEQLSQILAEAHQGDVIVLTDGARRVTLEQSAANGGALNLDLEKDSPELAAELLKAAQGPFSPYSRQDLEGVADQVLRETTRE